MNLKEKTYRPIYRICIFTKYQNQSKKYGMKI